MNEKSLHGIWNYYLMLERDLDNTSRYIEPEGQENVYSFEFAKLLILACTEVESVFKELCAEIDCSKKADNIVKYNEIVLSRYPEITEATVRVNRLGRDIVPFQEWGVSEAKPLSWWRAYNEVKHNRGDHFADATYLNAVTALSALYILIFYLAEITGIKFSSQDSSYIDSDYADGRFLFGAQKKLPGCENRK